MVSKEGSSEDIVIRIDLSHQEVEITPQTGVGTQSYKLHDKGMDEILHRLIGNGASYTIYRQNQELSEDEYQTFKDFYGL